MEGAAGLAGIVALLFFLWLFSSEGKNNEQMYRRGELYIGYNEEKEGYSVYCPKEDYRVCFTGEMYECQAWMDRHTMEDL